MDRWPIGVFTSIDAGLGLHLPQVRELGVRTVQIHAPHRGQRDNEHAEQILTMLDQANLTVTAVFGGFKGESYADIPTVGRTIGLVPAETREERLAEMFDISSFARRINCNVVALHLGRVPHDHSTSEYQDVVNATRQLCEYCAKNGQNLHLETGQEPADALRQFIADVKSSNLFINFDPANLILYGVEEPLDALKQIGHLVRSVHCKDARWAKNPGQEWGEEVPLGEGEVDMENYLRTLDEIGYQGPLTIEREIPQDPDRQQREISGAVQLLENLKSSLS